MYSIMLYDFSDIVKLNTYFSKFGIETMRNYNPAYILYRLKNYIFFNFKVMCINSL